MVLLFWRYLLRACVLASLLMIAASPHAQSSEPVWQSVREVVDGDTVILANGESVRLYGIQAPKLALGRKNFADWPSAAESREKLIALIGTQPVRLEMADVPRDRNNRILADLFTQSGQWLQGEMIKAGFARAYSFADNRRHARQLLTMENAARQAKRGIWTNDYYALRDPTAILQPQFQDRYEIIQGKVAEVAEVKKTFYLNFGNDWRRDFTAVIPLSSRRLFTEAKIKPPDLVGKTVRVRGWIENKNGPSITLTHPEQLEIIGGN